jgi:uncharacterized protein YoxC
MFDFHLRMSEYAERELLGKLESLQTLIKRVETKMADEFKDLEAQLDEYVTQVNTYITRQEQEINRIVDEAIKQDDAGEAVDIRRVTEKLKEAMAAIPKPQMEPSNNG